jgi:hypothetical protein
VTTTLGVTTSKTNGRAFTSNDNKTFGGSSLKDLVAQDTSTDVEGWTLIVRVRPFGVVNASEVVGPDRESTGTGRTTQVAVFSTVNIGGLPKQDRKV